MNDHPGTSPAIETQVQRWAAIIRNAARKYGLVGADLDELTQEIRIKLWQYQQREGEKSQGPSSSYMYQASMSAAVDMLRRRRANRERERVPLDAAQDVPSPVVTDEAHLVTALERSLERVGESRRPAVRLHLTGYHLSEIALILRSSEGSARNLLYRGLQELKDALREADS